MSVTIKFPEFDTGKDFKKCFDTKLNKKRMKEAEKEEEE
jgi:hypothetical protein